MNSKKSFFESRKNLVFVALIYTFLWGCAFPLVKMCMDSFGISENDNMAKCLLAGIRFSFSGIFTLVWCGFSYSDGIRIQKAHIGIIVLYGVLATALQYSFTYIALSFMEGSKGAVFDQLCVFVIILTGGIFFKDDKLGINKIIGCILGFAGVLFVNINGISLSFSLLGEGVMLLAVICQTAAYFVAKKAGNLLPAAKLVGYGQLTGGVLLTVFAYALGGRLTGFSPVGFVTLAALVFISAFAYVMSLMPLKYFPASEVSSFNLLITVFGVVMSGVILGENVLKINYFISLALISAGIIFVNRRKKNNVESI